MYLKGKERTWHLEPRRKEPCEYKGLEKTDDLHSRTQSTQYGSGTKTEI